MIKKKVAIVGGGLYGVTAAVRLASYCDVDLYEMEKDILQAASGINQFTLHHGYHYPRSRSTILDTLQDGPAFEKEYTDAIIYDYDHYYCIAKEGSLTTADRYLAVCKEFGLEYELADPGVISRDQIALSLRVNENLVDYAKLKEDCWKRLTESKVNVLLGTRATREMLDRYDNVVICTYALTNELLDAYPAVQRDYQYELIEKIVVKLPPAFANKSVIVMDGPFMVVSPYGRTGLFLMGNVVHCIRQTNVGRAPAVDDRFRPLLNRGIIDDRSHSNFRLFVEAAERFFPRIMEAEYVGSMYTIRTVLPHKDDTDERPTIVREIDGRVMTVFAGKLAGCVPAANEVKRVVTGS